MLAAWLESNYWLNDHLNHPGTPQQIGVCLDSPEAVRTAALTVDGVVDSHVSVLSGATHTATEVTWAGVTVRFFHIGEPTRGLVRSPSAVEPHELLEPVSDEVAE